MASIIEIKNLSVSYKSKNHAPVKALRNVNISVPAGGTAAVVGESGCGKSTLAYSLLMLFGKNASVTGSVTVDDSKVTEMSSAALQRMRGGKAGMIFQDPCASLNPLFTVVQQVTEAIFAHEPDTDLEQAQKRCAALLEETGLNETPRIMSSYPHQLSGGQQQRVMAAIALSCGPKVLIADEPTTALDVTVQAQIITMLKRLKKERNLALLLITHDLDLASEVSDRVIVMYAGEVVEDACPGQSRAAAHPYTEALFAAIPGKPAKEKKFAVIKGELPDMTADYSGCAFSPRCPYSKKRCGIEHPEMKYNGGRGVRCFYPLIKT